MCVEVPGEDFEPNDMAGWTAPGRRTKRLGTEQKAGESISSSEHPSRSRERVSYAKRVTARITKAARMPALPRGEAKIIIRPRGGLNIARTQATTIMKAVVAAAQISNEEARQDTVCLNPAQNIIVISTPNEERARKYNRMKALTVGDTPHIIWTYRAAAEGTAKGVIRGVDANHTEDDINENIVNALNPSAIQAHRIGTTSTVIILFEGTKVPGYVKYGPMLMRCVLYRKHYDVCRQCGKIGHRGDVCPFPDTRVCIGCGQPNPDDDHAAGCEPKCQLCGGQHITGGQECNNKFKIPYVIRKRQWERRQQQQKQEREEGKEDFPPLRRERSASRGPHSRGPSSASGRKGRSHSRTAAPTGNRRWETTGRVASAARSGPGLDGGAEKAENRIQRGHSRSLGGPENYRGNTDKKVGWAGGSPKAQTPESLSSNLHNATQGESAIVVELKKIIERQNAQIQELMSRLEKVTNNSQQKHTKGHEETPVTATCKGPRKMPRRRSPSLTPPKPVQNTEMQEMEAEEAPQRGNQQPIKQAEEQTQMTPGETAILAVLSRLEGRITTLEAKHDRLAARVSVIEVKHRYGALKKERTERLKETIAKRRGRIHANPKNEADSLQ